MNTAPPPWPTRKRYGHAPDPLPQLRPPRRDRVPLRRPGPRALPREPGGTHRPEWAEYLFYRDNTKGAFAERWLHSDRLPPVVQRAPRHRHLRHPGRLPDGPASPSHGNHSPHTRQPRFPGRSKQMTAQPQPARLSTGGRIDRSVTWRFTVDGRDSRATPATPSPPPCWRNGQLRAGNSLYRGPAARHHVRRRRGTQRPGQGRRPVPGARGRVRCSRPPPWTLVTASSAELPQRARQAGPGRRTAPSYDKKYVHTDVLVIGGGPAGLAAAARGRRDRRPRHPDRRPARARRLAAVRSADRPAETIDGGPPRTGWPTSKPSCCRGRVHDPDPHHRLRHLRRQLRHRRAEPHRPPRLTPARAAESPASGSGTSAPSRSSSPPAPTSARWCSPTTTAPA